MLDFLSGGGYTPDALGALTSLSTEGALAFNTLHPQGIPTSACGEGDYVVNGIHHLFETGPMTTYRNHVNRFKNAGL